MTAGRGRPKLHTDQQILEAALRMFATYGYDGMSLRSLNRELGLSHSAIHQRFGTKEDLYKAVIDHEFGTMFREIREHLRALPRPDSELGELQSQFKAFLIVSSKHPYLNRLMNNEGLEDSWHLDHIYKKYVQPSLAPIRKLMDDLAKKKVIKPTAVRTAFFLIAHGAAALFTLDALSAKFNSADGPIDVDTLADEAAWVIVNGLRR
ncbi:MAG: TetR/AcrR family transcriptional regulator [Actinobacteria bacterium]|nr:TetR/AcrR family transcriptional regulator [Actinomycetota bacterium]